MARDSSTRACWIRVLTSPRTRARDVAGRAQDPALLRRSSRDPGSADRAAPRLPGPLSGPTAASPAAGLPTLPARTRRSRSACAGAALRRNRPDLEKAIARIDIRLGRRANAGEPRRHRPGASRAGRRTDGVSSERARRVAHEPEQGLLAGRVSRAISPSTPRRPPWLLPYLEDRPLVLSRHPDGISGKSFYQKDAPPHTPSWVRTERIWSEGGEREIDFLICDDVETLLFIANMGTIPLHLWASRARTPQQPDWCILDLDPKGAPFAHVVDVARAVHRLADEIELPAFLKTSGSTGLHVLVPLGGQCTHAESRALGELIARVVESRLPEIATTARHVGSRGGRVYIDFLQNGLGKTIAGPFSARPLAGATVSTPLAWSELSARLDPARFTIETVPERMGKLEDDPLLPVLTLRPDLAGALARLTRLLTR